MRRLFLPLIMIVLLSLNLSQLVAQQGNTTDATSVLQIVDTVPLTGQELGLTSPITVYFDRLLDCASVTQAFSISPVIAGNVTCDGASLTFTPTQAYDRASSYVIQLGEMLRGDDGAMLFEDTQLIFHTVGFLLVSETFPAPDTTEVETDTSITVIFNRPVVALVTSVDQGTLPQPLMITPAADGIGRWINTSIYVWEPTSALQAGTTYEILVDPALQAADGALLPQEYKFVFSTQATAMVDYYPPDRERGFELDQALQVRFNQVMDQASVEASFYLRPLDTVDFVSGAFEWSDDSMGFRYTPTQNLAYGTVFEAGFRAGIRTIAGGSEGLAGQKSWTFETVPYPVIIGTDPSDADEFTRPFGGFTIYFSSPMNVETLEDRITIEPEPGFEPRGYYRDWSYAYEVSFQPDPSTTYTVTLAAGAEDEYGTVITEPYTFSYTTDAFPPEVSLRVPGSVGFYNAYREPTQVFVQYRNIPEFELTLSRLSLNDFAIFALDRYSYFYDLPSSGLSEYANLLRSWTVDGTEVPQNALRFDLLEFDAASTTISCPAALPSRLFESERAFVQSNPDPVRARLMPVDGEIVELLYLDYALTLTGARVCGDDGLLWWEVFLRDGSLAWVAESVDQEYLLTPEVTDRTALVDVAPVDGGALEPGIYYLGIYSDSFFNQGHLMIVGTANLVVKQSPGAVMVWATDVNTGTPIANAPLTVYGEGMIEVARGVTDADGIAVFDVPRIDDLYQKRMVVLDTDEHLGIGYTDWTEGIDPYQFEQSYNFFPEPYRVYLYTDRPVYRPGQPVYFRGLVRDQDDMRYTVPPETKIQVEVYDDQGEMVQSYALPLTQYGTFSTTFDLADDASLGYYYIQAYIPGRSDYYDPRGSVSFSVAEYRLPEFLVDVTPAAEEVVQGDTIRVTVDSTYFFGGAVSNAAIEYSVLSENYFFNYDGPGYYSFADYNYDEGPSAYYAASARGTIASGSDVTDDRGLFTIEIPASLGDVSQSQSFLIEAVVRDETDQVVAGRTTVTVHQGEIYLGARPESYVSTAGEEAIIEILSVDWQSQPAPNQPVTVEIVERIWSSVQERDPFGRTIWTWNVEDVPITSAEITTDADGTGRFAFIPERGGTYKAILTTRDARGNQVRSSSYLWVSSFEYVSWRQQNSNRIDLIVDQDAYQIGDTASILITSPFQGAVDALITVERGDVLFHDRVTMDSNSYVYELPIREDYSPNVFVSVMLVKGVDENNPVAGFRMGYAQIAVDAARRELNIQITSDVDRAQPQQTVTYTLRTTDWQGNPVPAEVGIAVTDLAALSLAAPNSSPIFNYFFSEQFLTVRTATVLTMNTDQLTQETLDTVKGGGGGLAVDGIIEIRGEFIDTPYWNASVVTDASGTATFDVRLPDNLTTWRLDARGVTLATDGNMLVGQDTFDLLSTKPIIIRPVTPRFFVVDDQVQLAAVVNNNTDVDQEVLVTIQATGITLLSDAAQRVTVPAGGRTRVTWDSLVQDVPAAQLRFTADAGEFADGSVSGVSLDDQGTLPVYRYEVPETVGTSGVLTTAETRAESIMLPQRFEVTRGALQVTVDQSLAGVTTDGLDFLRNYPHQCTEQTVSRFLPNIMTVRALQSLGLSDPVLEDALDKQVNFGLQKLLAEQHADGGWGWFVRSRSNALTTAYVLISLAEARTQGYPISEGVIERAQNFLSGQFIAFHTNMETWRANQQAFLLYALARSGATQAGRTAALFEYRENLSLYGRALLAETLWVIDPLDTSRTDVLLNEIVNRAAISASGVHWSETIPDYYNWNTDTRTTALILSAMIKLRPESDLLPGVVRYLVAQRSTDAWETTQETAWSVMALTDWMLASGELNPDYAYTLTFNDERVLQGQATAATARDRQQLTIDVSEMLQQQANRLVFTRSGTDAGSLYYTAYLQAYLPVPEVEPLNNGILIDRRYYRPDDATNTPITEARAGELVEVRLTIVVPNTLDYVVITDPLPAGAEGVDPNLEISEQIGTRPGLDNANPLRYGWGWWYFSEIEFRDEMVALYADYLPAGSYEYVYTMRAGVPGTYNVIPPTGQQFYFPDVYGRGAGSLFTILPSE